MGCASVSSKNRLKCFGFLGQVRCRIQLSQFADEFCGKIKCYGQMVGPEKCWPTCPWGGEVIPWNDYEARYWAEMAAAQGRPRAQNILATLYAAWEGESSDPAEAARW